MKLDNPFPTLKAPPAGRLTVRSVNTELVEVINEGAVVGALVAIPIPNLLIGAFAYSITYVGFAHDWQADGPDSAYLPVSLGTSDDPIALIAEIMRRAQEAHL